MTNKEFGTLIALENAVTTDVREICVSVDVRRENDPVVFDELKRKLNTGDREEILKAIMEMAIPKACKDIGIDVYNIHKTDLLGANRFDDTICVFQYCYL